MCDPHRHVFEAVDPCRGSGLCLRRTRRRSNCEERSNYTRSNWEEFLINSRKANLILVLISFFLNQVTLTSAAVGLRLSEHVTHFEPALYDVTLLRHHHHRAKRDADHTVTLDFTAHNREFKIRLRRDASVFSDDVIIESNEQLIDYDFGKLYSGSLEDDEQVEVSGIVDSKGLFDGHISTPHELYYIEPADRYLSSPPFHSVIYKASDVLHPQPARCSSQQLHLRGKVHNPWVDPKRKEDCQDAPYPNVNPQEDTTPLPAEPIPADMFNPEGQVFEAVHLPVVVDEESPISSSSIASSGSADPPRFLPPSDDPPGHSPGNPLHSKSFHPKLVAVNNLKESLHDSSANKHSMNEDNNISSNTKNRSSNRSNSSRRKVSNKKESDRKFKFTNHNRHPRRRNQRQKHSYVEHFRRSFKKSGKSFLRKSSEGKISKDKTFESNRKVLRKLYRERRATVDPKKTTCMLYLQADHLFYRQEGTEEACIDKITRHVQRVNNIYKVTDFDHDGGQDRIGFMIKRIKIHTENATRDPTYRFPGNYGVEKYLELFSEEDYDAFCLAYMFTYRDFEGGTLGLAWTGDLKNAGGVCEKNGHYRGSLKSLNTGIVTLLNYGKKVPPAVSHVTLAHEIGHNFGSPHDPEEDLKCTPGGEDGNYIMFARATSGDKRNNNKFSPCSLNQINNVLNSKARDKKGCFTEPQRAICGNGVVEQGEECDCGWTEDCDEKCCIPMASNPKPGEKPCTLRRGKICSPSQGPCCTHDCEVKRGDLCREDNGCRDTSYCDGKGPDCPPSINKPNKTICKDEFVCYRGECTGSICLAYGLESCQCKRRSGDPDTKSCELCCKLPGEDQTCLSSFDWNVQPYNIPDLFAKPGTPCDNYKGYCDVFQKCREVDPSGPLATLRKILLSNESLANIKRWVVDHWYAVLFLILALLVILVAITKIFGKTVTVKPKEKSHRKKTAGGKKKKRKTIMHENGSPGQIVMPGANGTSPDGTNLVVHPTVIRANIPFKRKVNEVKRAATKAKRVARSQLGKPYKKSAGTSKKVDNGVTSPNESEKSVVPKGKVTKSSGAKAKVRDKAPSSRFSIYSFKTFKPRPPSSPDKKGKGIVKNKSTTSVVIGNRNRSKSKTNIHVGRSPEKSKTLGEIPSNPKLRNHSPSKRMSLEDGRNKSKRQSSDDKIHDKSKRKMSKDHKNLIKTTKPMDGNWLINKFLADEEKLNKPIVTNNSIPGSLSGSLSSITGKLSGNGVSNDTTETSNATASGWVSGTPSGSLSCSPIISHTRNGSTRALITPSSSASPIRGVINEAFVASPRGARTNRMHSSLRGMKSTSPDNIIMHPCQYRRSISMETRQLVNPDRRKRKTGDEGKNLDKKRRFTSPDKSQKPQSKNNDKKHRENHSPSEKSKPVDPEDIPPPLPERNRQENIRPPSLPEKLKLNSVNNNQFQQVSPEGNSKVVSTASSPSDPPKLTFKNKSVAMETSPDEGISHQTESSSSSSAASLSNSLNSFNSFSSIPDRIREKLSLISSSSRGSNPKVSVTSAKKDEQEIKKSETCAVIPGSNEPKNWV